MATIDLGKIKQVWRGTYNNSTAYTVDDLVAYTDNNITSTYICVANSTGNAPSTGGTAHASWNFVAKGVADPIPSQSGNSGKFLKTDGSSLSFDDAGGGKLLKHDYTVLTSEFSTTNTSDWADVTNMSFNFTPSAANSKIWLIATPMVACADKQQTADGWAALRRGSTVLYQTKEWSYTWSTQNYRTGVSRPFIMQYIDTPSYTLGNSISYTFSLKAINSGIRCNWNSTGNSNFVIWEIAA